MNNSNDSSNRIINIVMIIVIVLETVYIIIVIIVLIHANNNKSKKINNVNVIGGVQLYTLHHACTSTCEKCDQILYEADGNITSFSCEIKHQGS